MFYEYQKKIAEKLLKNTVLETVFVNAQLLERDKDIFPAYRENNEFVYLGVDDTKGLFAYVRQTDNVRLETVYTEGCNYLYRANTPFRIVFCGLHTHFNSEQVCLFAIMSLGSLPIVLNQIILDSKKLFDLENKLKKDIVFSENMLYAAIDVVLSTPFSLLDCQAELECLVSKNRFEKCDFE